jgi:hypothetical protein
MVNPIKSSHKPVIMTEMIEVERGSISALNLYTPLTLIFGR